MASALAALKGFDFAGVVPFPFVATKTIAHPLVARETQAPSGWSHGFAERVRSAVLPGFAAFTVDDARRAAARLLPRGVDRRIGRITKYTVVEPA